MKKRTQKPTYKKNTKKYKKKTKKKHMEPSPWMGPQETCPESKNCNFPSQKKQKMNRKESKKTNGTQSLDESPRKHVR